MLNAVNVGVEQQDMGSLLVKFVVVALHDDSFAEQCSIERVQCFRFAMAGMVTTCCHAATLLCLILSVILISSNLFSFLLMSPPIPAGMYCNCRLIGLGTRKEEKSMWCWFMAAFVHNRRCRQTMVACSACQHS